MIMDVLQANVRLGLISEQEAAASNVQQLTAQRWKELLSTDIKPSMFILRSGCGAIENSL